MTRCLFVAFPILVVLLPAQLPADESTSVSFDRDIRAVFQAHCQGCHQPAKPMGDYVITSAERRVLAGESGEAAIVPGKPEESYLVTQITSVDGVAEMPKNGAPLSAGQVDLIRQWIAEGAIDDSPEYAALYDGAHPPQYSRPPVICSIDYAPDGSVLAAAGFHEVLLHAADGSSDGKPLGRLIGMSPRIESVRFSPDGRWLAVTGGAPAQMGEVQIWDVASRELVLSLPVTFDTVYGASWSPDSKLLACGCADNTVRVIEVPSGKQVLFQAAHSDWVLDTVFSADGSHLASVGRDATAKLIEVATQRFVDNITSITPGALRGGINAVARHPWRDEIVFGGADGAPKIYRMHRTTKRVIGDDANLLWQLPKLPGRIFAVDYSQDGKLVAAGSSLDGQGAIHLYGIEPEPAISEDVQAILIKPTHKRSADERARLETHFGEGIRTIAALTVDSGGVYAVAIHPESTQVAVGSADGLVRIVDAVSGSIVNQFSVAPVREKSQTPPPLSPSPRVTSDAPAARAGDTPNMSRTHDAEWEAQLEAVTVEPTAVTLTRATDYVQLVVLAQNGAGETIDVTRDVEWSSDQIVQVSPFGFVTARADGSGAITAEIGGRSIRVPVNVEGAAKTVPPDYIQDVAPIFARAGCNSGTCHGAQSGKNGFKLSLRGYDPLFDLRALTDDLGSRRTNLASPADSLFLRKPSGQVPHEGGVVLDAAGDYYATLLSWVRHGATLNADSATVEKLEVLPINPRIKQIGSRVQMRVIATYTDGMKRDVTREAFIESGNTEVAMPTGDHAGLITMVRRGEAPVLVRYEGAYAATTITVIGNRDGFEPMDPPANNQIDELVNHKLARTKTSVAPLCDDYTFVRRVYLDLTGLPPTPQQVSEFVGDPRDSRWRRDELIDTLIGGEGYVEHWTNKWADLLQVNGKFLGREGAVAFRDWIRGHVEANTPYDEFTNLVLTANGSNRENPAASYYKILRSPEATMENTTQLFLATRFNCNKCHDHPFERWTQDQYYQMSAYFARVGLKRDPQSGKAKVGGTAVEGAKPLYEIVFEKDEGEVTHQRTGVDVAPKFPFDCAHEARQGADRREQLAAWMVSRDNPYFAMSYANRIWAYLTGRGLIEPIDDIRAGNPPTNPELLEWLTTQFVESGFDTRHLIRVICQSRTYQLSLQTDEFNQDDELNYSHARARRLPAEVLYDAIYRTVGARSTFKDLPDNMRAAALPDVGIKLPDGFLNNLGRPPRESACECERSDDLQMGPVMALINGSTVGGALSQPQNAVEKLVKEVADNQQLVRRLFLRILNRPATEVEVNDSLKLLDEIDAQHAALSDQLADYKVQLRPILVRREQERVKALASKMAALTKHVAEHAQHREQLEAERVARLTKAQSDRERLRSELLPGLEDWLAAESSTLWETLNPSSFVSQLDEQFEVLEDGSVFVSGSTEGVGTNSLMAPADLGSITGIRLEALADDRLPASGPGRAENGNFVLTELRVWAAPDERTRGPLLKAWDLTEGAETWLADEGTTVTAADGKIIVAVDDVTHIKRLSTQLAAPAEPLTLEVTAKLNARSRLSLLWLTEGAGQAFDIGDRGTVLEATPGLSTWRTYRLHFHPGQPVTHLRLELRGDTLESEIDSIRLLKSGAPSFHQLELQHAKAEFGQQNYVVSEAIDGETNGNGNGWAISPQLGESHTATFEVAENDLSGDGALRVEMTHNYGRAHSLGRYRLSITRSPKPISPGLPRQLLEVAARPRSERSEEEQALLEQRYLSSSEKFKRASQKVAAAEQPIPPDPVEEMLKARVKELEQPLPPDAQLVRLQRAYKLSEEQRANKRLTAAQDIAWALINSPEFLYNH